MRGVDDVGRLREERGRGVEGVLGVDELGVKSECLGEGFEVGFIVPRSISFAIQVKTGSDEGEDIYLQP